MSDAERVVSGWKTRSAFGGELVGKMMRIDLVIAALVVVTMLLWALLPGLFTSYDPLQAVAEGPLSPPSAQHWFGTDYLGRDLFSRVVYGAALSLGSTTVAVMIGLFVGSAIGLSAGYIGGQFEDILMRMVDVLLAIPSLLLSMAIVTVLGFGSINAAIAIGVGALAIFARVMRSEVVRVRESTYVEAAVASGVGDISILLRHVLPNSSGPVVVLAVLEFGSAILTISALSFLGFGAAPPAPEWGTLISEGRDYLATSWWLTTLPGLVVVAAVLSVNRIASFIDKGWGRK